MSDILKPVVSVCIITYNQESFVRQTIEGILLQKCDFPFDVVLGEDCSSDSTRKICEEYAQKYHEFIRLLPSEKNIGGTANFIRTLNECTGKYIAICEGDDYWTDPYKLQKQVDFLEEHRNCSACFTNAAIMNELAISKVIYLNGLDEGYIHPERVILRGGALYPTASLVFRQSPLILDTLKEIDELNGDNLLIMLLSMMGDIYYLNQITCTYRVWEGGIYSSIMNDIKKRVALKKRTVIGLKKLLKISNKPYRQYIKERISGESLFILKNDGLFMNIKYLINLNIKNAIRLFV